MTYRVFATQGELDSANSAWMNARHAAGTHDICRGIELTPEVTAKWSNGRLMLDGRLACPVPTQWADDFGGSEEELTEEDFPAIEEIE